MRAQSRGLRGARGRCDPCAACVSEEVEVRHQHAAAGCELDREAVEGCACPSWVEREVKMRRKDTHKGTDNVLIDLGFDQAEELSAKAIIAVKLNQLIRSRGSVRAGPPRNRRLTTARGVNHTPRKPLGFSIHSFDIQRIKRGALSNRRFACSEGTATGLAFEPPAATYPLGSA